MHEDTGEVLSRILERLQALTPHGDNAVLRRATLLVLDELLGIDATKAKEVSEHLAEARPGDTALRRAERSKNGPLNFSGMLVEHLADDRRRAIFLDRTELLAASLYDLYTGRITSLECRVDDLARCPDLRADALELIRPYLPIAQISDVLLDTPHQQVAQLKALANVVERDGVPKTKRNDNCTVTTRVLGGRFIENGRKYETHFQTIRTCPDGDTGCGNCRDQTEVIRDWWEVTWSDGNPKDPPPITPPPYTKVPWNNQIPLLADVPANSVMSSDWGWRNHNDGTFHQGIDVTGPQGTRVRAVQSGVVLVVNTNGINSNVIVRAGDNYYLYEHIAGTVAKDAPIMAGDIIGTMVDQGSATHVHYAHYNFPDGQWVQPKEERAQYSQDPLQWDRDHEK